MFAFKFREGFDKRLMKGEQESSQSSNSTSSYDPMQSDYYQDLLNRSESWLSGGGIDPGTDYTKQIEQSLTSQGDIYQQMMSGNQNQEALMNAMNANSEAATQSFERNVLPTIGTTSNLTGGASGSRRGIAEGIAASDLNNQISQQNANMIYSFEQSGLDRQMQGAQGMNNLLAGYQQLGNYQNARNNAYLESLNAYKQLVSGNMGGTETSSGTQTGEASGGGSWI